jgi:hypothetical protein
VDRYAVPHVVFVDRVRDHETGLLQMQQVSVGGVFTVQCIGADGQLKWEENLKNLVVNVGLKDMNDKYFTGSGYTATWFIGLYGAAASNDPAAGDTAASAGSPAGAGGR